jgi:uncharacterized SAM-binding protein YcdF (DUF218 family)
MRIRVFFKILFKIVCLGLVALLGWVVYIGNAIYQYGSKNEMETVDAIVVLGAGAIGGKPSPVFRARLDHGIWLYDNGYGNKLILTGGKRSGNREADAEIARRYVQSKGVFRQDIFIETKSRTTEANIANAKQIARRARLHSLLIVSDPLHMKRAMLIACDQRLKVFASPTPTTRYIGWKSKMKFLAREIYFYSRYSLTRWSKKSQKYLDRLWKTALKVLPDAIKNSWRSGFKSN